MSDPKPDNSGERFRRLVASEAETQGKAPADPSKPEKSPEPGSPQKIRRPVIDKNGFPLPNRVEEVDVAATHVTPAAYEYTPTSQRPSARRHPPDQKKVWGCLLRGLIALIFVIVTVGLLLAAVLIYEYYTIAAALPSVSDLREHAAQFETTRILDRNNNVLYEILDPNAGRRTYVSLEEVSPYLVAATIATEDQGFYSHPGFDPIAIARALWQNLTSGETVSGASTITQQLARTLLLSPEERGERTYRRKVHEVILAAEITRRYSKDEILELYLNEIYYGNLAYGVEAAAETYFNKRADQLTLAEAAFLAGLPQAPSLYDIYSNPEAALKRQQQVLVLMYELNQSQGCIYVSNSTEPVCVDASSAALAAGEMESYNFQPPQSEMRYPHWVQYVRGLLETQYDPQTIYRSGFTVYTSLDPGLQDAAQQLVSTQVATLADRHVTNGALVAIRPSTGEILVMVGSADFDNEAISGQVNMAASPTRQPGSSIKPINYVAAFEKGWTPATLIWDVSSEFPPSGNPNDPRPPYVPVNYDEKFHGPVTVRVALANSYNIPAVKTLQFVGIYDNPETPQEDGMVAMARRLGITSLTLDEYGLSLTLGGGDVSLLELTGAYAVFANGGLRVPPVAIMKIVDHDNNTIYEYKPPQGEQVIRPEHAFLISSILSDNEARAPMFGRNSLLNLPFQVAAKTGTTNDFRDNWTLGYTPDLAVGVWVGNADYTPMQNTTGLTGAAPIWSQFMPFAVQQLTGGYPSTFARPAGVEERIICAVSGSEPSKWCPSQRSEYFVTGQPPLPASEDLWQEVLIDTWTGLKASPTCPDFTDEKLVLNVSDPWARKWIKKDRQGIEWAEEMGFPKPVFFTPTRECRADDPSPKLEIVGLKSGQKITTSTLDIYVVADAGALFDFFQLDYGLGNDPARWKTLVGETRAPVPSPSKIYTWDLAELSNGAITLRLYMRNTEGGYAERLIQLILQMPTPTPTPTPTNTPTFTPLPTETPTTTPTWTPSPTATPTFTPTASTTPTPP